MPLPSYIAIPLGLLPNHICHIDVTYVPSWRKLKYVHVTVDTYSLLIFTVSLSGETVKNVINFLLQCF